MAIISNNVLAKNLDANLLNDVWKFHNHKKLMMEVFRQVGRAGLHSVVDAGCGEGLLFPVLSEQLPEDRLFLGFDIRRSSLWRQIAAHFFVASAHAIPIKDKVFDLVLCKDVLHHTKNPRDILKELIRISSKYVVVMEANRRNLLMIFYTKTGEHEHFTREQLYFLTAKSKVTEKHNLYFGSVNAYPFYLPMPKKVRLQTLLHLFPNFVMVFSFRYLRLHKFAEVVTRLFSFFMREPSFNIVYIFKAK